MVLGLGDMLERPAVAGVGAANNCIPYGTRSDMSGFGVWEFRTPYPRLFGSLVSLGLIAQR